MFLVIVRVCICERVGSVPWYILEGGGTCEAAVFSLKVMEQSH